MFKLPLDSLLTVAQPTPQLIEVQARFQHVHNIHNTQPALNIPFTLQLSPKSQPCPVSISNANAPYAKAAAATH